MVSDHQGNKVLEQPSIVMGTRSLISFQMDLNGLLLHRVACDSRGLDSMTHLAPSSPVS